MNELYTNGTDRWLSPPELVAALGPFDLDPCCEPWMPWRTATRMLSLPPHDDQPARDGKIELASIAPGHRQFTSAFQPSEIQDGLAFDWATANWPREAKARVWMNHPYSMGLPWAEKMVEHGRGIALTAAKSTDTRWCQLMLENCSLALFLSGRIRFHYLDGAASTGAWLPNALWAFGTDDASVLRDLVEKTAYRGVYMRRT
jgi:hypothetical protein